MVLLLELMCGFVLCVKMLVIALILITIFSCVIIVGMNATFVVSLRA